MTDSAAHPYDAFISYARRDGAAHADRLEQGLQARGLRTWRDTRDIDPTQDFTVTVEDAIKRSRFVVVCVTPDVNRVPSAEEYASFVRLEISYARAIRKPMFVVTFDSKIVPPIYLINHTRFFFDPADEARWGESLSQLCARFGQPYTEPDVPADADHNLRPYVERLLKSSSDYLRDRILRIDGRESHIELNVKESPEAVPPQPPDVLAMFFHESETDKPFSNFAEAFQHFNQRMLLLGEPGAGKTITLTATARQAAADWLSDPATHPLPILDYLSRWDASQQPSLAEWLGSQKGLTPDAVRQVMTQSDALLLLDGLDEMGGERTEKRKDDRTGQEIEERYDPRKRFLQALKAQLGNNHALVTCRIADYATIGDLAALEGAVTLQKLSDAQLRDYLKDLPALLTAIETDLGLNEIARTPLLLSFFAFAFRDRADDLKALEDLREGALRDAIFNAYMDKRYAHEERRLKRLGEAMLFTLQEIKDALGRLAMENAGGQRRDSLGDRYIDNVLESRDFDLFMNQETQNRFIDVGIRLQYLQQRTDGTYGFIHLLLRHTLVYGFSLPRLRNKSLHTNPSKSNPALSLGAIRDRRAFGPLLELAEGDQVPFIQRVCAIDGLGLLGDARAVEPLLRALSDPGSNIRYSAAAALGRLGDARAVEPLLHALSDPDEDVRSSAADALGLLGDARAVEPLLHALSDPDGRVRSSAADALGKLGEPAVEPLIRVLSDPRGYIRSSTADALGKLGEPAVEPLIRVLSDPRGYIRSSAAEALRKLGDARAVEPLIRALSDPDKDVRSRAADALAQLGDARAVEPLLHALSDPDRNVRSGTVAALGRLGDARAVERLTDLLSDTSGDIFDLERVCDAAAIALQSIGTPEALAAVADWRARGGDKR
jgi:HEAT repeat protein